MNLSPVSQTGFIYIIWHKETSHLSFFSTSPPCLLLECSNLEKEIFCLPLVLLNKLLPITHCVMYLNIFGKHESFCHFYSTKWNLLFCGTQWKVMWLKKKKNPKWGNADSTETDCTVAQLGFTTGADKRFFNFFIRAEICLHVVMYLHVCQHATDNSSFYKTLSALGYSRHCCDLEKVHQHTQSFHFSPITR